MPLKKKRKKSQKQIAKDNAWKWFSRLRRTECCLEQTGTLTNGYCLTCGKPLPITQLQCGHAVSSRCDGLLFCKEATGGQCMRCNIILHGQYDLYSLVVIDKYGLDKWRELIALKEVDNLYSTKDFNRLAIDFEHQYRVLVNSHKV